MMLSRWLPFEWIVAMRFLREGRMQTAFIIAGVASTLTTAVSQASP